MKVEEGRGGKGGRDGERNVKKNSKNRREIGRKRERAGER